MKVEYEMPPKSDIRPEPRCFSNMSAHGYEWGIMFDPDNRPAWRAHFVQPTTMSPIEFLMQHKKDRWTADWVNSSVNVEGVPISQLLKTYRVAINNPKENTIIRLGKKTIEIDYFSCLDQYTTPTQSILNPIRTIEVEGPIYYIKEQIKKRTNGEFQHQILKNLDNMIQTAEQLL